MRRFTDVGIAVMACAFVMASVSAVWAAERGEALFSADFSKNGPLDAQLWTMVGAGAPNCEGSVLFSARGRVWNSVRTFSEPVSVEFSGVYLSELPRSGANALSLSSAGYGPEMVAWIFDGSTGKKLLVPVRASGGVDGWKDGYARQVDLATLPDITKKENAVTLRMDWWPGKAVRHYLNGKRISELTDHVPSAALPVGVRDEMVGFRIGGITVTKATQTAEQVMAEIAAAREAEAKVAEEAARVKEAASKKQREILRSSMPKLPLPEYALLLHLDGGAPVKDSSVFGFEFAPTAVAWEKGRFGSAARFDGEKSSLLLDKPMIEHPDYQYLSFSFARQTVECWVRPERAGVRETILGAVTWFNPHDPAYRLQGWQVARENDGRISFSWGGVSITSKAQAPAGEWTHIAATVDAVAGQATLFVNGRAEGTAAVGLIQTGGKFLIGAGDAGFYKGLVDEVAVRLNALSPDEAAARAKADQALLDPKPEPRFYALPANDHTFVFLCHGSLPGNWLLLRLPEYAVRSRDGGAREARNVRWVWEEGGWTYTWGVPAEEKKAKLLDFTGRIVPGPDKVYYELTAGNPGDQTWPDEQMNYACMRAADAPEFHDTDGTLTFVRKDGRLVTVLDAMGGKLSGSLEKGSLVGGGPGPLFARRSADGQWALGILTDAAVGTAGVVGNFVPFAFCMHSNPAWGELKPAESRTNYGCVYLIRGDLDKLVESCKHDFPQLGL